MRKQHTSRFKCSKAYNNNDKTNSNDMWMIIMMSIMILTVMITHTLTWEKKKSRPYIQTERFVFQFLFRRSAHIIETRS